MWNYNLASELSQLFAQFMAQPTCNGNPRKLFRTTHFCEWAKPSMSKKLNAAFRVQLETWLQVKANRDVNYWMQSLMENKLCILCNAFGKYKEGAGLCSACILTPAGRKLASDQAIAAVRKRWEEDHDTLMAKQIATSQARYGTDYPWQNQKANKTFLHKKRNTCVERYGHMHHLMNSQVFLNHAKASFRIKTVVIDGRTFHCQGYEPYMLRKLCARFGANNVISQFDETFRPITGSNLYYAPDFYIASNRTYVEVKSTYTLMADLKRNRAKALLALTLDIPVVWFVVHRNKHHIRLPSNWYKLSKQALQRLVLFA